MVPFMTGHLAPGSGWSRSNRSLFLAGGLKVVVRLDVHEVTRRLAGAAERVSP